MAVLNLIVNLKHDNANFFIACVFSKTFEFRFNPDFVFLDFCRKEFLKLTPTILIIGAILYFSRRLSAGAKGQGVSIRFLKIS